MKTHINILSFDAGRDPAVVYTGRMNHCSRFLQLIEIKFPSIEPPEIIDHSDHEFTRIVCFQVEALITLHCKRSGVRLTKTKFSKAFDLPPHFCGYLVGVV